MTHQELANNFCKFVYDFINELDDIHFTNKTDERFYRVCFHELYYALYHKALHHDKQLSESTSANMHNTIKNKLKSNNREVFNIFSKIYTLRIWADYEISNNPSEKLNIKTLRFLQYQVYKIIKRKKITL